MALRHPTPGLRTIHYWGVSTGKAQINVNLGDELHVPDAVAEQLIAQSPQFKDGPAPAVPDLEVDLVEFGPVDDAPPVEKPKRPRKS